MCLPLSSSHKVQFCVYSLLYLAWTAVTQKFKFLPEQQASSWSWGSEDKNRSTHLGVLNSCVPWVIINYPCVVSKASCVIIYCKFVRSRGSIVASMFACHPCDHHQVMGRIWHRGGIVKKKVHLRLLGRLSLIWALGFLVISNSSTVYISNVVSWMNCMALGSSCLVPKSLTFTGVSINQSVLLRVS